MSVKRQATTELNHDNWDQEDTTEHEEMGTFKTAAKEVLEKRVIRTAKRRTQISNDEPKKSVFSGFGGFNKIQQSSFDFLANLTNGNKANNGQTTTKTDTPVSSNIFTNKSQSTSQSTGFFNTSGSSAFATKPSFGKSPEGSLFGSSTTSNTSPVQHVFSASKTDSAANESPFKLQASPSDTKTTGSPINESPFKLQTSLSTTKTAGSTMNESPFKLQTSFSTTKTSSSAMNESPFKLQTSFSTTKAAGSAINESPFKLQTSPSTTKAAESANNETPFKLQASPSTTKTDLSANTNLEVPTSQVTSSIFGSSSKPSVTNSLFSSSVDKSTTLPTLPVSNTSTLQTNSASTSQSGSNTIDSNSKSDEIEERRLRYYSKLKGLNESVSEWIKKHVDETPLCILSPIFKDYENHLRDIQAEYKGGQKNVKEDENKTATKSPAEEKKSPVNNTTSPSVFGNTASLNSTKMTSAQISQNSLTSSETSFNFGVKPSAITTTSSGFSFGIKSPVQSTASSIFSVNATATTNANTPFSFGINKSGFSFNTTNPPKTETAPEAKEEDDEPPKVEYTPVVEENSVFDKKCKIFIKKNGDFVDNGVGTLYIKKVEGSGKHQLLVRANTNLGNVLLNLILSPAIPAQRMGKNNVMLVCIPTPDAKPPPTPILIRVKTAEEADELFSILEKYKV